MGDVFGDEGKALAGGATDAARVAIDIGDDFFATFMKHNPLLTWIVSPEGTVLYYNGAEWIHALLGKSSEEIVGRDMCDVLAPAVDLHVPMSTHRQVLDSGKPVEVIGRGMRPDGAPFFYRTIKFPVRMPDGAVNIGGFTMDVTAQQQAIDALQESESRFRMLIEDLDVGVVLQDPQDRILISNSAAARLLGLTQEQLRGLTARDPHWKLICEDGRDYPLDEVPSVRAARTREPVRNAVVGAILQSGAEPRWFQVNATPRVNPDGSLAHVLVTLVDITERNAAEAKRRELEAQLAHSQKLEALGRLAGGVAHDFNNLLTVITGYCDLLRISATLSDAARDDMLAGIQAAAARAAALTRQLLTYSRKQVTEPRVLSVNAVVADTRALLHRLIGEDIRLETRLNPSVAPVKVDEAQLGQVLVNLALNARDAMPTGGTLTIETDNIEISSAVASRHPGAGSGPHVVLSVSDTGLGITPEVRARLFEPFFTTKAPGKGTGLGLATTLAIAQQHKGFLDVRSEPGRGSTFSLYLPVGQAQESEPEPPVEPLRGGGETILLVEDETAVQTLSREILARYGYHVLAASSGSEALRLAKGHAGKIDLLVTDVVMPEMGGRLLAEQLTRERPGIPVLYVSGYTDDAVVRYGVQHEAVWFLHKPFTAAALAQKVRATLDAAAL